MGAVVLHQSHEGVPHGVAALVDAIGTAEFGQRLIAHLHAVSGADHCAVFQLGRDSISALASSSFDARRQMTPMVDRYVGEELWREDPAMSLARSHLQASSSSLIRIDLRDAGYGSIRPRVYPQVSDRIVICGRRQTFDFGLSVLRSSANPDFSAAAIDNLVHDADTLLSTMAKHASVLSSRVSPSMSLAALPEIAACIAARTRLPRREVEVCARVLYGMSTIGIALDIGIGEESVRTYRKRAYQRLAIGTERELLRWYLAEWGSWRGCH